MVKIGQAVKLVMAGCIGYFISYITMKLPEEQCMLSPMKHQDHPMKCPVCPSGDSVNTQAKGTHCDISNSSTLNMKYKPRTMYEVIQYDYFEKKSMYNSFYEEPMHGLLGHEKADIGDILNQVLADQNKKSKAVHWRLKRLVNGYRRFDPSRGAEYILQIEMISNKKEKKKVYLDVVKPFNRVTIVKAENVFLKQKVNFILPLAKVGERFQKFIQKYEEICLNTGENVALIMVLFNNQKDDVSSNLVKSSVAELKSRYPKAKLTIIETDREFSRGFGLNLGIEQVSDNDVVYFCDVDVMITSDFLTRCRLNSIQNEQVYYPIVFAQYDPNIVKNYSPKNKFKSLMDITKYSGHWVHYAYGMVCMYKSDYVSVGGFDLSRQGWGGEDVELYTKHAKSHLKVFRAMDPGLIHIYHSKYCDSKLSSNQYEMCTLSASEGIGSRQQLGKLLLYGPHNMTNNNMDH